MAESIFIDDPTIEVKQRLRELAKGPDVPMMDERELAEREEAAQAYAGEDEPHFVNYLEDCVKTSVDAMREVRRSQAECWQVYNEDEPPNYANKEAWQSRVIVPKPFGAVQFGKAIVRKAFDVQYLSIDNEQDKDAATFWEKLMTLMLSRNFANFPIQFTDAAEMGFAIGQAMEMIPVWRPNRGLRYILVEPWKIHRDPDAVSRQPQSGMYWIHQEYLDYWLLKQYESEGRYVNVMKVTPQSGTDATHKHDPNLSKEAIAKRKEYVWARSQYRNMILTSEFWGTVLDKKGELLLPNATYTVAGDKVISRPKASPYPSMRWPGMAFSPIPHLLRFGGRGLIQGVKSLWHFMCSLMCLHNDNLNWVVNPPTEIDISALVDPSDVDNYPGKQYLTRGTVSGQQAVRTVERRSATTDVLANMNFCDQRFQEGTFVTNLVQGLPGYRAEVTARESAQSLEQALTIFSQVGKNLEDGALNAILAGAETIAANLTLDELAQYMGEEEALKYMDPNSPTGIALPQLTTGSFQVSGISALMRDWEIIRNIREVLLPLFASDSVFLPYLRPYSLLQSLEQRMNLRDEGLLIDSQVAGQIDQRQQQAQEMSISNQQLAEAAAAEQALRAAMAAPTEPPAPAGAMAIGEPGGLE